MNEFFDEAKDQSIVKATIVEKYFNAWATIMAARKPKIGYVDLYSGPGCYDDGTESTPIRILNRCINNSNLSQKVFCYFNDGNQKCFTSLQKCISSLPDIDKLKFKPAITNDIVDDKIATQLAGMNLIPCFSFIDPFGYAGLSRKLITAVIKDWGCDCLFFFNYNRINAAITNPKVFSHIDELFGTDLAKTLRDNVRSMNPKEREAFIINELSASFVQEGKFVLPFRFQYENKKSTSHYIIFVTKNPIGYKIMKDIMAKESSENIEGIASFSYIPTTNQQLSLLFSLNSPLTELGNDLLNTFKGRRLRVIDIFNNHNINTPFILSNYKKALIDLEKKGLIFPYPAAKDRKPYRGQPSMADNVIITFPR